MGDKKDNSGDPSGSSHQLHFTQEEIDEMTEEFVQTAAEDAISRLLVAELNHLSYRYGLAAAAAASAAGDEARRVQHIQELREHPQVPADRRFEEISLSLDMIANARVMDDYISAQEAVFREALDYIFREGVDEAEENKEDQKMEEGNDDKKKEKNETDEKEDKDDKEGNKDVEMGQGQ